MKKVFFLVSVLALAGCSKQEAPAAFAVPPVPVHAAQAERRDLLLHVEAMGTVHAAQTVEVKTQVPGTVMGVHFVEGDHVNAGDLLFSIDEAPYAIKVQEMEAHLLQNVAHLRNAKKKMERYKSLSKQDLIAQVEWDELETKILLHEALIKADRARVGAAKLELKHCRIVAPISGKVGRVSFHKGSYVSGESLVSIAQIDPLYVDFSITEKELALLSSPDLVVDVFAAGTETLLTTGKVTFFDHQIDPKSGMLALRAELAQTQSPLWPGQAVRVHLIFGKKEHAIMVPIKAIKTNQNGPYLFAIKEDKTVESRCVKLGREENGFIAVEEGLDEGEKVVTEGQLRLYPGSTVEEVL